VEGNPINFVDPIGLNPNCTLAPRGRCAIQRFYEIVSEDPVTASKNALTLVYLFEDEELQSLWGDFAGRTVSERLKWILDLTRGSEDGSFIDSCTIALHLPLQFHQNSLFGNDDNYFKEELRDNQFYGTAWTKTTKHSNQVGHFLTGVSFGYSMPDFITDWFVIGHELRSDNSQDENGGLAQQLKASVTECN
jgi:hypothetical protein